MSALMVERRDLADDRRQESLFEAHAPPREVTGPLDEAVAPPRGDELDVPVAPATEPVGERRVPHSAGTPLAGPTLDDVMSRVWEGLVTGLPAACPVCHSEVEPTLGGPVSGRCRSCGMAID
jgi:hypothetical protein